MVARLVFDAMWRNRWMYLAASGMLLPFWLLFGVSRANPLPFSITALSLIVVVFQGPMFAILAMALRALRHLPVSNRDIWRATWVIATVVPTAVLLVTQTGSALLVAASGGSPKVTAESMLLSAVYDFTWASAMLPVFPLLVYDGYGVARRGAVGVALTESGAIIAILVGFGLPILFSDALPTRIAEFTPATTAMLITCIAMAFGMLAWTPQRGVLAGERAQARRAVALPGVATRTRLADRLTGISRVVIPHLLATLALPVGACLVLACYGVMSGSGPWWFVPRARDLFDPADAGDHGLTYFVLVPCAVVIIQGLWTPWVRVLKVLPLSVRQINALLLLTPVATWAILWLVGLSVYALAHGTPPALRADLAFGLAGIGAVAHAALLRFQGGTYMVWISPAIISGLMPLLMAVGLSDGTVAHEAFAIIGAIALCTAAVVNHHTLTRSTSASRAYRRPEPPFGVPKTPIGIR